MRRFGLVATILLASLLASPASAVDGYTQGSNVVLYEGCRDWPIAYSFTLPPEATNGWTLSLTVLGPDGLETSGSFLFDDEDATTGTTTHQVCGSLQDPGRYTVTANGDWYDEDYNATAFTLPTSSFSTRSPRSKTTVKALSGDRLRVTVKDERPNGFFATEYPTVKLQALRDGSWRAVSKEYLSEQGRGTFVLSSLRGLKVRAVTLAEQYASSRSSGARIHH